MLAQSSSSWAVCPIITDRIIAITVDFSGDMKQHAYIAQRLPNVQHLHAEVTRQADWSKMLQLAGQLPALHSLHCTGPGTRKWWEASSSIIEASAASAGAGASAGLLPQLQALVFPFAVHGLAGIAALAPNLQQLWCQKLVLSSQAAGQARMQHVTHYGVSVVAVQADDTGVQLSADAVGSRFSAAFPALQVLFDVPAFQELEYQVSARLWLVHHPATLDACRWRHMCACLQSFLI